MDKVTVNNPASMTTRVADDIPVAQRDLPKKSVPTTSVNQPWLFAGLSVLTVLALGAGALVAVQLQRSPAQNTATATPSTPAAPTASPTNSPTGDTVLGHFKYAEAPASDLRAIVADGSIKLRQAAATAYQSMEAAARRDGVILEPISGFRSLTDQDYLFFGKKAERGQVARERAKVSAPPGYSEHHTGYAVDIGDGNAPATHLSESFERTAAFQWLQQNAPYYSFEISFPRGNEQGVSYEPWHWRYVGDRTSLETFYKARGKKADSTVNPAP